MTPLDEHTRYQCLNTAYAGVPQRWLVIDSDAAQQRALKTVSRQCRKQSEADTKAFTKLCAQSFTCAADAEQALAAFQNTRTLTTVAESRIVAVPHYQRRGRPAKDRSPEALTYQIDGALASIPAEGCNPLRALVNHNLFMVLTPQECVLAPAGI
jgi:transposase